jgi:hypothetical protein
LTARLRHNGAHTLQRMQHDGGQDLPRVALKPVLGVLQLRLGARRPDHQEHEWNDHQREPDEGETTTAIACAAAADFPVTSSTPNACGVPELGHQS